MTFISGLAGINDELAKRKSNSDFEDKPKAKWLSLKGGESVKVIFLQELDEGSPNYSEKNGVGIFALSHSNPENWRKSAKCTADEGSCYGCDRGWRSKVELYINVLVDNGVEEPYVAIWRRALGKGSVGQALIEIASDEDYGNSISDKQFKFARQGSTKDDTTYTLTPLPKNHDKRVESFDLYDVRSYVFYVKPEKQEAYYLDGQEAAPAAAGAPALKANTAAGVTADW